MVNEAKLIENMLRGYLELDNAIKNLDLDIEELEREYNGISPVSSGERTGETYKISNPTESEVLRKEEKIDELYKIKRAKEIRKKRIDNAMNVLNENEREVIIIKFIRHRDKSWGFVAKKMDLSEAWVRKLKDSGIQKMIPIIYPSEISIRKVSEK